MLTPFMCVLFLPIYAIYPGTHSLGLSPLTLLSKSRLLSQWVLIGNSFPPSNSLGSIVCIAGLKWSSDRPADSQLTRPIHADFNG